MLFASGRRSLAGLFATHPPIEERLKALQASRPIYEPGSTPSHVAPTARTVPSSGPALPVAGFTDAVGTPADARIEFARHLASSLPAAVWDAAHRIDGAIPVALALILDEDDRLRTHELNIIEVRFGVPVAESTRRLREALRDAGDDQRLAVLDLAFPAIRGLDRVRRDYLLETMERIAGLDGRHSAFESALLGVVRSRLRDLAGRRRDRPGPQRVAAAATHLIARMARIGHDDPAVAGAAFRDGMRSAGPLVSGMPLDLPSTTDDADTLGRATETLDGLAPPAKKRIVSALAAAASSDGEIVARELALLRATCSALHCPVPPLTETGP